MTRDRGVRDLLPEPVRQSLEEFRVAFDLTLRLWALNDEGSGIRLYPEDGSEADSGSGPDPASLHFDVSSLDQTRLVLELKSPRDERARAAAGVLRATLDRIYEYQKEIGFFTYEVSERYEEINLLYSISETLGSVLRLDDAARAILREVCDVLGALRGSLWVFQPPDDVLKLVAFEGEDGLEGPIEAGDPHAITSQVFREGRPLILSPQSAVLEDAPGLQATPGENQDSVLSVPIRYTPPSGDSRTVGVINLIGRKRGGRFSASDQKLLSAIASQVGAALENNRLIQESLAQERVTREMELAHNLQMKLLPSLEGETEVAARVEPAESVGGDFYHFFRLHGGRLGVMIGDVSSHGFPAALIMALSMSAATIYASEIGTPERVLRYLDDALRDELENTEMYLTLFYGVVDPEKGELVYANAGHPHAFIIRAEGEPQRLPALDPPVGIAGPASYEQRTVPWCTGEDLLLLFTDGLSDTLAPAGRNSGEEAVLAEAVRLRDASPSDFVEALFALVAEPAATIPADDRSALVLRA
ncbi:MAG: GAF domain-containing SpoIIE family protein phosphatase [Gemmatimonadota bacterium]